MLELWLIRHGETLWNREGRVQGQSDPPLSALGMEQAKRLGARLKKQHFDTVYASDLERAHLTACLALPEEHLQLDTRLRELDFGLWEGKIWREMQGDEGAALEAWWQDPYQNRAPEGESYQDLMARVRVWLAELPQEGRVVAFTHGGTIRTALYAFTGPPAGRAWRFHLDNTGISKLFIDKDQTTLWVVNDTAHLEGLFAP